jgi:hypothetical protein
MVLLAGRLDGDHLAVRVTGRVHPEATGFWDANWLAAELSARGGAFRGEFTAELRADELLAFATQLEALGAEGAAALESSEGVLTLKLSPDGRGGLAGPCEVRDDPAGGSQLRFRLSVTAEGRARLLTSLRAVLGAFPVIGEDDEPGSALLAGLEDDGPGDA